MADFWTQIQQYTPAAGDDSSSQLSSPCSSRPSSSLLNPITVQTIQSFCHGTNHTPALSSCYARKDTDQAGTRAYGFCDRGDHSSLHFIDRKLNFCHLQGGGGRGSSFHIDFNASKAVAFDKFPMDLTADLIQ
jgi:hypothetical protein